MIPVERAVVWLIKFGKKKYMDQLQNGQLFMHNLQYYIDLEKEKDDHIIGDEYEGKLPIKDVQVSMVDPETHNVILSLSSTKATFDFGMSQYPVFCSLMFDNKNRLPETEKEPVEENGELYATLHYGFSKEQCEEMLSFGDTAVIITDVAEFVRRVSEAAKSANAQVGYGPVNYYCNNEEKHQIQVIEQPGAAPLWKRERYKNQREYRFYLDKKIDDSFVLNIGDIHDISISMSAADLLNSMVCAKAKIELLSNN